MSTFGDGTFKQAIYEEILWRMKDEGMYTHHAVQQVMEICSYMLAGMEYDELYDTIKEHVKKDLINQLGK